MASLFPSLSLSLVLLLFCNFSDAHLFQVGGSNGFWKVPSSPNQFQDWAERIRFQLGDTIVFKYDGKTDSVLEVTEEDYKSCNTGASNKPYTGGETAVVLDRSGPFFFISGVEGHCLKGQKLEIKVLSKRNNDDHSPAAAPAPASSQASYGAVVGCAAAVGGVLANLVF